MTRLPAAGTITAMEGDQGLWPRVEHLVRDGAAVLAAAGALLYGMIALAYDRFYRVLGISPRDVGLTESAIVARTAVVLALMAALSVAVYAALRLVAGLLGPWLGVGASWGAALMFIVGAPVVLAETAFPVLLQGTSKPYTVTVVVALALAAIGTLIARLAESRAAGRRMTPSRHDGAPDDPPSQLRVVPVALWICALGVSYYAIVQGTTARAGELAADVVHGACIPPAGRTFIYDVHADPVQVTRGRQTITTGAYDLYLGESNDWVAVYDVAARRTVRESRDAIELHFTPQSEPSSPCP